MSENCTVKIGVGVYILRRLSPMTRDHEVLLIRHIDDGLWRVPGGGRRQYEPINEACSREVLEEVGLLLMPATLRKFYDEFSNHDTYGEWLTYHATITISFPTSEHAAIQEHHKHNDLMWLNLHTALSLDDKLFGPTKKGLEALIQYLAS